jgi:hypothetical protein
VVGHHDYRRATHRDGHFRKAFAEVFRSRSLLFLGSSLAEPYMLDLFGEVLEFYGANPQYHFAFVRRGEGNADFLRTRFNIEVLEYDDYEDLPRWLNRLRNALNAPVPGMHSRRYTLAAPPPEKTPLTAPAPRGESGACDLEIVYSALPLPAGPEACTALSAGVGSEGQRYLSASIRALIEKAHLEYPGFRMVSKTETAPCVDRFGETPLYCVVTRNDTGARDLRVLGAAMEMLCDRAALDGFETVHTQLFAVGRGRAFPGPFSLVTMIRAFAGWRRAHPEAGLRLVLHVIDPDVRLDIDSGRIDVLELLSCEEVRFWVEIRHDGLEAERHIELRSPETTLGEIAERYHAASPHWRAEALPAPTHLQRLLPLTPETLSLPLTEIGIVPGSTLRFRRHPE